MTDRPLRHNERAPLRELGPVFVQLHNGPAGPDGMANRINLPRAQATRAQGYWDDYGLNAMDVAAHWPDTDGISDTIHEHTIWTGPIDGRLLATGRCDPPVSFGGRSASITLDSFPTESV